MVEMERASLKAELRTIRGKQVGALRRTGKLPGVIYGHNVESTAITMDLHDASKLLAGRTASSLVTIDLEGKQISVLVREKQRDFIRGTLLHVDFQAVSLSEKIRAKVGVILHGVSPAVKDFNAIVVNGLQELEVEALPQDLPEQFILDISILKQIGDGLYVRDITVSDKVQILDGPDEMLTVVTTGAKEEEPEVVEGAVSEPEIIERGKKEEEGEDEG
jgi:large subunit ribosomal protein L25